MVNKPFQSPLQTAALLETLNRRPITRPPSVPSPDPLLSLLKHSPLRTSRHGPSTDLLSGSPAPAQDHPPKSAVQLSQDISSGPAPMLPLAPCVDPPLDPDPPRPGPSVELMVAPTTYMASQFLPPPTIHPTPYTHLPPPTGDLQSLSISIASPNLASLYTGPPPTLLPITLFPSIPRFTQGRKVAVDGVISYATRAGRIRVIDQSSGARMLLRKHETAIADMGLSLPGEATNLQSTRRRGWRCIASVGIDGRLLIWKVPVRFEDEAVGYEVLVDIIPGAGQAARFQGVRWHPRIAPALLVGLDDGRLAVVRLDRGVFGSMWKRGAPLGRALSVEDALNGQDVIQTNSNDGSAFAFITADKMLTIRQTSKPFWTIMGGQLGGHTQIDDRLEFIGFNRKPQGFLVSRDHGRRIEILGLSGKLLCEINFEGPLAPAAPASPTTAPELLSSETCFGCVNWVGNHKLILASNSLRGSIHLFKLRLPPLPMHHHRPPYQHHPEEGFEEDASFIESSRSLSHDGIWIEKYIEISSPEPIISFVTDQGILKSSQLAGGDPQNPHQQLSVFNVHQKGIHQLVIPKELLVPDHHEEEQQEEEEEAQEDRHRQRQEDQKKEEDEEKRELEEKKRRQSIVDEGAILVDVEVRETVEHVPLAQHQAITTTEASPLTSAPPIATATATATATTGQSHIQSYCKGRLSRGNAKAVHQASVPVDLNAGSGSGGTAGTLKNAYTTNSVAGGSPDMEGYLRRVEENVVDRMASVFETQLLALERKWERERAEEKIQETSRQEKLLEIVSEALERNVRVVLRDIVRSEVRDAVVCVVKETVAATLKHPQHLQQQYVSPSTAQQSHQPTPPPPPAPQQTRQPTHPRPLTPQASYEDIFLQALSDGTLDTLIDGGPHDRLQSVFGSGPSCDNPNSGGCALSQPVLLTLLHKLSEGIGSGPAAGIEEIELEGGKKLGRRDVNRLRWIWSCLERVDFQDEQTGIYLDRVLELVETCLINRRSYGLSGEDLDGINEVLKLVAEKKSRGGKEGRRV